MRPCAEVVIMPSLVVPHAQSIHLYYICQQIFLGGSCHITWALVGGAPGT